MSLRVSLPQKVTIEYNCYKCDESFCDGTRLRMHLNRVHNVLSPPPTSGKRRRSTHNACPSCLEHFFDMNGLVNHLNQQHLLKERIEDCAIIQRKSNSYCFFPALKLDNSRISSTPKLSFRAIQELENIIKIIAPFNQKLSSDNMNSLKEQQANQDELIS
ncbi:hypothetical protein CU097_006440 [Rhizopus azygosporus]|uniref:C2H2-type domain-containing protein n=1 Tax=Rhizopus azygosporus TaxID=86630 RepID=A0A367J0Y3_RHIAZ|nr:hypothetical protein CU097_006440 [Rhizopus azygosporus]